MSGSDHYSDQQCVLMVATSFAFCLGLNTLIRLKQKIHGAQSTQIGVRNAYFESYLKNKREIPADFTSLHKMRGFLAQICVDCAPCIFRLSVRLRWPTSKPPLLKTQIYD